MDIPKSEQLKENLKFLKGITYPDFNGQTREEYVKIIDKIVFDRVKYFFGLMTSFKSDPELRFFKARQLKNFKDKIYDYSEHSYVPEKYCTLQRANYPKHPVMYCAEHPTTALLEIIKNSYDNYSAEDNHFIVTSWTINDYNDLKFASFLDGNFKKLKHFKDLFENTKDKFKGILNDQELDIFLKIYNEYATYIGQLFLQDKYAISAYYAYNYLYRGSTIADILIYPSIQIKKRAVNYAIRTDIVDTRMSIKNLYHISIDNIDFESELINTSLYAIGKVHNKKIEWTEIDKTKPEHKKHIEQFHTDFGENVE